MKQYIIIAISVVLTIPFAAATCVPSNYVISSTDTDIGTIEQNMTWETTSSSEGVIGWDPKGHVINSYEAEYWTPVTGTKEILNGTFHHYTFYHAWGDEEDWNNYIVPSDGYFQMFETVLDMWSSNPSKVHNCSPGVDNCMEAEITPDAHFYENPWFPRPSLGWWHEGYPGESPLEGRTISVYGPLVVDSGHGNRPEIHPSELIWWRDRYPQGDMYYLMLLQDDSNRFDRNSHFDLTVPGAEEVPASWRPWSAPPRTGEFKIAFEINPANELLTFYIGEFDEWKRNVVTSEYSEAFQDADDGKEHAIEYDGQVVLRAIETQENDDDIGVRFEVWRNLANTRLRGYVKITSMVGVNDDGGEGYQVIWVQAYRQTAPESPVKQLPDSLRIAPSSPKAKVLVMGQGLAQSLRNEVSGGELQLIGDVYVKFRGGPTATSADLTISRVILTNPEPRRTLRFTPDTEGNGVIVRDIPVANAPRLELIMESGIVLETSSPPISLAPYVSSEDPLFSNIDMSAWDAVVVAVDAPSRHVETPPTLRRVSQWQLDVVPGYAPMRDGKVSPEDEAPFSEKLNEVIHRYNAEEMEELFGSSQPFKAEWTFEATNLTKHVEVPVIVGQVHGDAPTTDVHVEFLTSNMPSGSILVTFPDQPSKSLYRLTASAEITDMFGNKGYIQHRVWSHILSDEGKTDFDEAILMTVADLAEVSADDLRKAWSFDDLSSVASDGPIAKFSPLVIGRMLWLATMYAIRDGRITIDELSRLIRGARLFGSQ
jgi:hypothetical protein